MSENVSVSIIMRTKDRPDLLKRALASIAAQTHRPMEVVLVNDGGCDLDIGELRGILRDVPLVYVRLERNMGRAGAANAGLEKTRCAYVAFLDDDDLYYSSAIETLVGAARLYTDKAVYGKVVCKKYDEHGAEEPGEEEILGLPFDSGRLVFENFIPVNSLLIPRHFFQAVGPFDETFEIYEDWDYLLRLAEIYEFWFVDAVVAEYSIHGTATITGKGGVPMQLQYKEQLLEKHLRKAKAQDFLRYVQRMVDRAVLRKDAEIDRLTSDLSEKESLVVHLLKEIEARDNEINARDREIKARDKEIEARGEEIRVRGEEIDRLRRRLVELEEALAFRVEEIGRLTGRVRELEMALEGVLSSHSWKITKPLRAVGSILRGPSSKRNT